MTTLEDRAELISFRLCPFVMRTQITGLEKGVELRTRYIDITNKPQWFLDLSPTGTVPALWIDDTFIFESAVICDLIDELTPGSLYPEGVVQRLHNRSWIDFASQVLFKQYALLISDNQAACDDALDQINKILNITELEISNRPFWNGQYFSIIDAAYAPFFARAAMLRKLFKTDVLSGLPKLSAWSENILANSSVQYICTPELESELIEHMKMKKSYLTRTV